MTFLVAQTPRPLAIQSVPILLLGIALCASVAPVWTTDIPPATDLAQHLGQIRLLELVLAGEQSDLVSTPWYYPNTLIYWILYAFWQVTSPLTAGKLILSTLTAFWLTSTWSLSYFRQRSVGNWLIATPLTFNFLFNWGLLNFLVGWPVFCALILATEMPAPRNRTALLTGLGLLLYFAHALWFAMANVWLAALYLDRRKKMPGALLLTMLPAWILALIWYPKLSASRQSSGVSTGIDFGDMPIARLAPENIVDSLLGTLHTAIEPAFCVILLLWLAAIVVTRWNELESKTDRPILVAALIMLLAYWALPAIYMNTIFFYQRWLPFGVTLLLLGLPAPHIPRYCIVTLGIGTTIAFAIVTAKHRIEWEREQLEGFSDAVALTQPSDRLIGLNLLDGSFYLKGRPGLQLFAYAQALQGAALHFSFTEHYSGAVQFRNPQPPNPIRHLVWHPARTRPDDLAGYNRVLLNADPEQHVLFSKKLGLTQISPGETTWRLYAIEASLSKLRTCVTAGGKISSSC